MGDIGGDIWQAGLAGRVALECTPTNPGGRRSLVPRMNFFKEQVGQSLGFWIVDPSLIHTHHRVIISMRISGS